MGIVIFSSAVLTPIFEELIFRGWFDFKLKKVLMMLLFLQFAFFIYDRLLYLFEISKYSILELLLSNFYVYFLPERSLTGYFFNINNTLGVFHFIFKLPFVFGISYFATKLVTKPNINAKLYLILKLSLIYFSSIAFYLAHYQNLIQNLNKTSSFYSFMIYVPICVFLPLIRIKYGLKQAIILHSIYNISTIIIIFNELNSTTFLYYIGCICVIGGLVWSLFKIKKEPVIL